MRKALGFDRVAVMGHSLPSGIALEYARKYPEHTSHLILIGSPPFMITPKESEAFWQSDASEARKLADKRNLERITDEDLKKAPPGQAWKLQFVRNGAHYWYDPSYDSTWMLEGIALNMNLMPHVAGLFRDYDVSKRRPRATMPVFLALGRYDYLVSYHTWEGRKDSFPNLSYNLFEKSGHYPMFEEPALFDQNWKRWFQSSKLTHSVVRLFLQENCEKHLTLRLNRPTKLASNLHQLFQGTWSAARLPNPALTSAFRCWTGLFADDFDATSSYPSKTRLAK